MSLDEREARHTTSGTGGDSVKSMKRRQGAVGEQGLLRMMIERA